MGKDGGRMFMPGDVVVAAFDLKSESGEVFAHRGDWLIVRALRKCDGYRVSDHKLGRSFMAFDSELTAVKRIHPDNITDDLRNTLAMIAGHLPRSFEQATWSQDEIIAATLTYATAGKKASQ